AFDALVKFLREAHDTARQNVLVGALNTLGDKRAADAFIDRIENDPAGTAQVAALIRSAANFRVPATAGRLLLLLDRRKELQTDIFAALKTISGYDQRIDDPEDENPEDRARWTKDQHPRHDAVLAKLAERAFATGNNDYLAGELMPSMQWSLGKDIDPILG